MSSEDRHEALVADLARLADAGALSQVPVGFTERVMRQVPLRSPSDARRATPQIRPPRRRAVALALAALLVALLAAPPVRAAVAEWFGFAGVRVRVDPGVTPSSAPPPPPAGTSSTGPASSGPASSGPASSGPASATTGLTPAAAADLVTFPVLLPTELGTPDEVEVSADRRLLAMTWDVAGGTVRLDQFDGALDYAFAKTAPRLESVTVSGRTALWFDAPHEVWVLAPDGSSRTEAPRLAGTTLIWDGGTTTLRLEGELSLEQAVRIIASARQVAAGGAT